MAKKPKMQTPDWILEDFDSKADWEKAHGIKKEKKKGKTFKIRECPKCKSDDIGLVLSNSDAESGGGDQWECNKCKWKGADVEEKELTEDELMAHLDKKGEDVA
jgi:hypothetical protein